MHVGTSCWPTAIVASTTRLALLARDTHRDGQRNKVKRNAPLHAAGTKRWCCLDFKADVIYSPSYGIEPELKLMVTTTTRFDR